MGFGKLSAAFFNRHAHVIIAVGSTLVGLALFTFSGIGATQKAVFTFVQSIEQRSLDLLYALRGSRTPDPNIVIVDIDEKTLQKIESYPPPRDKYALLIRRLKADGAAVVAFDVTFPLPASNEALAVLDTLHRDFLKKTTPKQRQDLESIRHQHDVDQQFADALKDAGNVVLGHLFLDAERAKYADAKTADAYCDVIWGKAFPQVFKNKSGKSDFDLSTAWSQSGGFVAHGVDANLPRFAESAASYGFFNITPDEDGTLREALLMIQYRCHDEDFFFPPLDLEVLRQYEDIPDQQVAAYMSPDGLDHIQFGAHTLKTGRDGKVLINYVGPYHSYPHYSMADVLEGGVPTGAFRKKIVLIGATALGFGDLRNTPFQQQSGTYMGVEVHANIIDNLLHSNEPHRTFLSYDYHEEIVDFVIIIAFGAGMSLWFGRCKPVTATISFLIVLGGFLFFVYFAFEHWGRWYSVIVPSTTLLISYVAATSYRVVFEEQAARQIRKTFSQYLSPDVISLMEEDPEKYLRPGGELHELTIMFSDIRNFTTISEGMSPDDLVRLLNEYFTAMTDILLAQYGTLDKYIGDAIMAFWGSPYYFEEHAYHACLTALQMTERLGELNRDWAKRGSPEIAIGIGINSGPVNVGNIGSEKRLSWTVMGDNVNLTSRLEGVTKLYKVQIIISESTYLQVKDNFVAREMDKVLVEGKEQPATIYELMARAEQVQNHQGLLVGYSHALESYRARKWEEAVAMLEVILGDYPSDGPTQVLMERCRDFMKEPPPEDWDGVYVMKSK